MPIMPYANYATMPIMPYAYAHYALCLMPIMIYALCHYANYAIMPYSYYVYFQGLSSFLYLYLPTLPLGNRGRFHFISSVLMSYFKFVLSVWTGFFFIFNNFLIILILVFKLFSELFI